MKIGLRHQREKTYLDADKLITLDTTIQKNEFDKKFIYPVSK